MNPFEVLEISPDASAEDIKTAYHRLAKQWHPDRYTGKEKEVAEARFRELAEAFSILKDPGRRLSFQQQMPRVQAAPATAAREQDSPRERSAEDWAGMAREAFKDGKVDQARALVHYAIRMDGSKAAYHALLASILEQEGGDVRAVVKSLEMAVRLDPKDVESHIKLAGHFQSQGMSARAQRHLQLAHELAPNHPKLRQPKAARPEPKGGKRPAPTPPPGLVDQLRDLWDRLTRRG
jgi:curved DNA-binding protein CbpA